MIYKFWDKHQIIKNVFLQYQSRSLALHEGSPGVKITKLFLVTDAVLKRASVFPYIVQTGLILVWVAMHYNVL